MIKNLNQLKRMLKSNSKLEILGHCRKECIGEIRQVTLANTQGFYSLPQGLNEDEQQKLNDGKGYIMWWGKAPAWCFENGVCSAYEAGASHTEDHLIIAFRILEEEAAA